MTIDKLNYRDGEQRKSVFRTDRFCQVNGSWYFITREQTQEGPFTTRFDAQAAALDYVRDQNQDSVPRG